VAALMNVTADADSKNLLSGRNVSIALALLLAIAYLGPAFGTESFFYRDFGVLGYPTAAYQREMFWRGELPLWNPYSNCGVPFLAQWGTMVLYPFTLIYCLLPFPWSLNFFCLLHLWWGAIGVMRLARQWTNSGPAAAMAAVLFVFNGITQGSLSWPNYTVALAWMPWIILLLDRTGRGVALAALAGTMQMLAGAPEVTLLTWMLAGGLWLAAPNFAMLRRMAVIVFLIAGLSAAQLFPFFELFSLSQRPAGVDIAKWALPPTALPNFLLPMLHAFRTSQGTWFQFDQHFLSSTYLGGMAVVLAALGAIYGDRKARVLAGVSVLCVLCAMGGAWQKLPFLGLARYPVKFVFLLPLTISLLGAVGIRILEEKKICAKTFSMAAGGMLAFCVALIFWTHAHPLRYDHWRETFSNSIARLSFFVAEAAAIFLWIRTRRVELLVLLLAALFVDGRFHLQNQNPTIAIKEMRAPVGSRPLPRLGEGRVFISAEAEKALLTSRVPDLASDFIGKQLAVWSHLNLVELAPKVNGSATLQIREQKELQDQLYSGTNSNLKAALDALSVTYVTAPGSVVEFTNRATALPLVRIATNRLGKISDVNFREHEITFSIDAPTNTAVIVAQSPYPAWKLSAKRANETYKEWRNEPGAFQTYDLPAGPWAVRIYYDDKWFKRGTTVSLLTMLGLLYFAIRSRQAGRARA
jgi:hypothetical protein